MATKESKALVKPEPSRALSPFEVMEQRFAQMERMFDDLFRRPFSLLSPRWIAPELAAAGEIIPLIDVFEEGDDVVIKAELPGMKKDEISVDFSDGTVIISGEKRQEEKIEKKNYHMIERTYGSFTRSVRMPVEVQAEKAKATFRDGILEVRVPRTEEARKKERKIPIQ
jgi:HSP20 family protein